MFKTNKEKCGILRENEELHDLLKQCFKSDPNARPTAGQLSAHPFFTMAPQLQTEPATE